MDNYRMLEGGAKVCVDLWLSFDEVGGLGSSNFVFDYDPLVLANPVLDSINLPGGPFYQPTTLTSEAGGRAFINVELNAPGYGETFAGDPGNPTFLATICFDYVTPDTETNLNWYIQDTRGTIVFADDEATLLEPGTMVGIDQGTPFPVSWLDFMVHLEAGKAILDWSTSFELNNDYFEVERSTDGLMFQKIDQIPGKGDSQEVQRYQAEDPQVGQLSSENIYYRIRQVDMDGSFSFSRVVALTLSNTHASFEITPFSVPFSDQLELKVQKADSHPVSIVILNNLGQMVYQGIFGGGVERMIIPTAAWADGVYHIRAKHQLEQRVISVQKKP
ncbi:MAG: hypothetical protein AAFP92_14205 [Bacteroidota bacterium]